jgi:hypothetical protein
MYEYKMPDNNCEEYDYVLGLNTFQDIDLFLFNPAAVEVVEDLHQCIDIVDNCEMSGEYAVGCEYRPVGRAGDKWVVV